jgi:murein DD-endopeptidase MepM/ murein hydrolase activator NlpD
MILSDTGMAQNSVKVTTQPKPFLENSTISGSNKQISASFRITSPFGWRVDPMTGRWALHQGVDIARKRGSPILAPAKGRICKTSQQANLGYLLIIDHGNGYVSSYGHLDGFAVREGDCVQEGQLIATLGSTGKSSGTHLHYELRYWVQLVNPAMHTMAILQIKGQFDPTLLTGCDKDAADRRSKTVF